MSIYADALIRTNDIEKEPGFIEIYRIKHMKQRPIPFVDRF